MCAKSTYSNCNFPSFFCIDNSTISRTTKQNKINLQVKLASAVWCLLRPHQTLVKGNLHNVGHHDRSLCIQRQPRGYQRKKHLYPVGNPIRSGGQPKSHHSPQPGSLYPMWFLRCTQNNQDFRELLVTQGSSKKSMKQQQLRGKAAGSNETRTTAEKIFTESDQDVSDPYHNCSSLQLSTTAEESPERLLLEQQGCLS